MDSDYLPVLADKDGVQRGHILGESAEEGFTAAVVCGEQSVVINHRSKKALDTSASDELLGAA